MEPQRSYGFLIKQINDELQKAGNNAMRVQGMTVAQLSVLLELDCAPEQQRSLKELEQSLHVAQSTVVGIVNRLQQKGFLEALGDASDRRVKLVHMTPAGRECVAAARKSMAEAEEKLLSGLTEAEREIFYVLLEKVRSSLG